MGQGKRNRTDEKLFNLRDLVFALSDVIAVSAVYNDHYGRDESLKEDSGLTLSDIQSKLYKPFLVKKIENEIDEDEYIDLASLHHVVMALTVKPKKAEKLKSAWLSKENKKYRVSNDANNKLAKSELELTADILEHVAIYIRSVTEKIK